jgi:hypothetical protein
MKRRDDLQTQRSGGHLLLFSGGAFFRDVLRGLRSVPLSEEQPVAPLDVGTKSFKGMNYKSQGVGGTGTKCLPQGVLQVTYGDD